MDYVKALIFKPGFTNYEDSKERRIYLIADL